MAVTYYNRTDLVKFGKYVLSEERREYLKKHPEPVKDFSLHDRLKTVTKADVDNWLATA